MQTEFSTRTAPEQRQNSRERQRNYRTILGMKRRILHLAGIDNRDADTILAICASMPSSNAPADYTRSKISNRAIAGKLCLNTRDRESLERAAPRRLSRLLDQGQPNAGYEFITRIKGKKFNPETSLSEMHTYVDNITPASDQAYQAYIEAVRNHSDWKRMPGAEKAAFFDQFALDALSKLPVSSPVTSEGETAKTRMNLSDYTGQRKRQILSSVQQTADKIEYDYGDPAEKIHFYIELSRDFNAMIQSEIKVMRRVSKELNHPPLAQGAAGDPEAPGAEIQAFNERIEKEGGEEERWLIQGDKIEFETLDALETQTPPPDKMSPPPCDNLSEYTDLQQAIPAQVKNTRKWGWVNLYLERGWAVCLNYYVKPDGSCSCQAGKACDSAGKHPMGGITKATRERGELSRKLRDNLALNVGIATGEISGFDVLDFDGQAGIDLLDEWESKGFIPADCLRAITGSRNGIHILIEHIPGLSNQVRKMAGIDIRTTGSQIVVAPSVHLSGNEYEWEKWSASILRPSAEFKEYLLSVFGKENSEKTAKASAPRYVPTGKDSPAATGDQARFRRGFLDGGRNVGLFKVAAALRGEGFNRDQIIEELKQRNILCNPPKPETELFKIANSVSRYPQGVK